MSALPLVANNGQFDHNPAVPLVENQRYVWYASVMQPGGPNPDIERVRFSLRADGVKPDTPNKLRSGIHSRGYLPHVKREGASYFVTFRLADSLPQEVLMKFQAERAERLRRLFALLDARKKNP